MCKVSITLEWEGWYRVDGQWCINVALGFAKNVHLRWPKKRGRRLLHEQSLQFHLPNHKYWEETFSKDEFLFSWFSKKDYFNFKLIIELWDQGCLR